MLSEKIIIGEGTRYPLNGLLTLPENTAAPVPAVVLVHGSGSSNMDEKVMKLTPFKDLAEGLAQHGVASLRYDKRSFTYGLKMIRSKEPITVRQETIEDAILAAELLRRDPRIDADRVFIIGHSMGAMLAPRIDAEGGNFRGLILMAGTPRKIEEVLDDQIDAQMSSMNAFLRALVGKKIGKLMGNFDGLYEMTDEEAKKKKYGGGVTMYYFKEMGEHAAPAYLEKTTKPMLILQGGKDFQVDKEKDFGLYKTMLQGRENVTFRLYDDLNHCFVPAIFTDIIKAKKEYSIERHIGSGVIRDIAEWILQTQ
ncbi:MAG: alpha/beta fold hydrolase [Clostridia bacterium]|nr:alpha/beta fold hydrolase [Clostridia bacterium]